MEKLQRELDGFCRTSSGFCAVVPKMSAGITPKGMNWFQFKSSAYSAVVRVEWPKASPVALIDNATAMTMVRLGYAQTLSDELLEQYNKLVDQQSPAPAQNNTFPPEGWLPHPTPGYYYKGQEVLSEADLRKQVAA